MCKKKQNLFTAAFKSLSPFDIVLLSVSIISITVSFLCMKEKDILTLISSLLGICGVFFVGKGMVLGQFFFVAFSVFYGIVSFRFRYFSEMITYLGMNTPIAIGAIVTWLRHPFMDSSEVEVAHMRTRNFVELSIITVCSTVVFYFILKVLKTNNLIVSTISIATSVVASYFELVRSSYYALAFMFNDAVLIALWGYAFYYDKSYLPMVICFVFFLINDTYGFINWQRMKKNQSMIRKDASL